MKKLKIGVFAYNWPHYKTQAGLINLSAAGFTPDLVLAADPVELKFYKSKIRVAPKDLYVNDTSKLCSLLSVPCEVVVHNSEKCVNLIKEKNLDIGVILGARILKKNIIESFNIGVINMHPGILPENRGLDNLKWAIIKDLDQGVTSHLIDSKIDKGRLIDRKKIKVYKDDTLVDIHLRIQSLEQKMMIESIERLFKERNLEAFEILGEGETYHRSVPPEIEKDLMNLFEAYVKKRGE